MAKRLTRVSIFLIFKKLLELRDMSNERELVGWELVNFLMQRWNMTEDEALQSLAENIGNVELEKEEDLAVGSMKRLKGWDI